MERPRRVTRLPSASADVQLALVAGLSDWACRQDEVAANPALTELLRHLTPELLGDEGARRALVRRAEEATADCVPFDEIQDERKRLRAELEEAICTATIAAADVASGDREAFEESVRHFCCVAEIIDRFAGETTDDPDGAGFEVVDANTDEFADSPRATRLLEACDDVLRRSTAEDLSPQELIAALITMAW